MHILGVAAVLIAVLHINLRVLGVIERENSVGDVTERYLPLLWAALALLALTGFLLIASEPNRAIFRSVFWVKLALVTAASIATALQPRIAAPAPIIGAPPAAQEQSLAARVLAVAALVLWVLVVFAGRWIAYADPWPGAPG